MLHVALRTLKVPGRSGSDFVNRGKQTPELICHVYMYINTQYRLSLCCLLALTLCRQWVNALDTLIKNEKEKLSKVPLRNNTKLWWAETKQGQFCFELDEHYEMVRH